MQAAAVDTAKMERAFSIVDPSAGGTVAGRSWREEIHTFGTSSALDAHCRHLGVTFDDVLEAIRFYTATEPRVTREPSADGAELVHIRAEGYRNGPAGP
jgi:hypothetical protein